MPNKDNPNNEFDFELSEQELKATYFDKVPTKNTGVVKVLNDIGLTIIYKLAYIQCTYDEIAEFMHVTKNTLLNENNKEKFYTAYKSGYAAGHCSLRRYQFLAGKKGNAAMLIWLGKQYLGQTDKIENSIESEISIVNDIPEVSQEKTGE